MSQQVERPKVLAPHKPVLPRLQSSYPLPAAVRGAMVGGPWIVDANFRSAVYIKNSVETSPVTVTPVLYLSSGTAYALAAITLEADGTAVLDIGASLQSLGIAPYATLSGSIELQYNWPWAPICATIRDLDATHSVVFSFGLHSSQVPQIGSTSTAPRNDDTTHVFEGLWWKQTPSVTGFVSLTNTTTHALSVSLDTSDSTGASFDQHTAAISAHGTKTIDLNELAIAKAPLGGLRVTFTGFPNDLLVNGGLEDIGSGYSANIPFTTAPASNNSSTASVAELGLMTGPAEAMMHFPAGVIFTPYTFLRNVSNVPLKATPTIWWMADGTAQSYELSSIGLQAYQSEALDIPALLGQAGLATFAGNIQLVFQVEGNAGSLLLGGGSVDRTNTYVFEVTPHGVLESASKSLSYWNTADGDDTMVTIWNPADEAQDFVFQLSYAGGHYNFPMHLEARTTRTFNLSEIVDSGIPDPDGNVIPSGVHDGSAEISGSLAENQTILVAMDAGIYNVRRATCYTYCQTCNGVTGFSISANPFSVAADGQTQLTFYEIWNTGAQYDSTTLSTWSTSNSGIATVGTPGSGTPGLVSGVSGGSVTIGAKYNYDDDPAYTSYWCEGSSWTCPYTYYTNGQAGSPGTVADQTPVITSISPGTWNAGTTTTVTIAGQHFGTNTPTLTLSPTFSSTITSHNDTQIVASIPVSGGTPTENVKVSVTSNGYNGNSFTCGTGCQSSPTGSSSANTSALAAVAPRILLNGTDVTGSTQTVVIGERIALTASIPSPQSSNLSSQLWSTPSGTAVGGYSTSVSAGVISGLPTNASGSYAFYWVAPGSAYQMTYHYALTNGSTSPNATVTFNVVGPSSITITPSGEEFTIVNSTTPSEQSMDWGIVLQGAATQPSGYSGSYSWFQIVESVNSTDKLLSGGSLICTNGPGFDAGKNLVFPYASGLSAEDGPSYPLDSTSQTEGSETASFQSFLMWNANIGSGANASIPVALAVLPWSIFGDVVWNTTKQSWVNKSGNGTTTNTPFGTYPPLPTWSAAVTPTTEKCN